MIRSKVYMAGTKSEENYRNYVKKHFGVLLDFIDPFEEVNYKENSKETVKHDLKLIESCDLFMAYIGRKTFGTVMETKYAHDIGKPTYVITTPEFSKDLWLSYHSTKIFFDVEVCLIEMLKYFGIFLLDREQI